MDDIKAFARKALLDAGYDMDVINVSEEGVNIHSFKKLVKSVYELGWKEGFNDREYARGTRKDMEELGEMMTIHQRNAKFMEENNQEGRYL